MDCEQARRLISAHLDREMQPDDGLALDAHLAECADCRVTAEAFQLQDAGLRQAFVPRRQAAAAVAEQAVARIETVHARTESLTAPRGLRPHPRLGLALAGVAAAAAVILLVQTWMHEPDPRTARAEELQKELTMALQKLRAHSDVAEVQRVEQLQEAIRRLRAEPAVLGGRVLAGSLENVGLTPRARPATPAAMQLTVGQVVETPAGQRKRVGLPDGSILYVNQNSRVRLESERQVMLDRGEVFVEVAAREVEGRAATFVVRTPKREVAALGTKFAVRTGESEPAVVVTQGKVKVSGFETPIKAGQQLAVVGDHVTPIPRASCALDWTRDLMAAAEAPLVPDSRYGGGALIAVDANGQEAKLSLRNYHIDVHIEDGFARTTIDQTYFNHTPWRLEGTFYFPLPAEASLSRLAMYVDGKLMEGGMAERDYARQVYERILYTQRDPALLEWVDGTTFKMRVFPLEGRQEKRIVLAYTQRLPVLYGRTTYRFPAGHTMQRVGQWSFEARVKGGASLQAASPTNPAMKIAKDGGDLVLKDSAKDAPLDRDVVLDLDDPLGGPVAGEQARFSTATLDGERYLMLRYRPLLPAKLERQRRDWVFLFESSGDRDPLLARVQIEVIRAILANAEHEDTFAVITAGTRTRTLAPEALPATPANVVRAIAFLEQAHLVGALDLGRALNEAEPYLRAANNATLVHVGSGIPALGERREDILAQRIPSGVRYVGVGVGKRWARNFMKSAAERSGGTFTQINPDEPVAWRAFELVSILNTPRLLNVRVDDPTGQTSFLLFTSALSQGEELAAVTRLEDGRPLPQTLRISGLHDGNPYERVVTVGDVAEHADYLPRTWAKLEIDRLLSEEAQANKPRIIELSKAMYVMTPYTSLLVLENEEMYKQFNVDRGRKDHWALYPCPDKIPIVFEPDPTQAVDFRSIPKTGEQKPQPNEVLNNTLVRVPPSMMTWPSTQNQNATLSTALQSFTDLDRRWGAEEFGMTNHWGLGLGRSDKLAVLNTTIRERMNARASNDRLGTENLDDLALVIREPEGLLQAGIQGRRAWFNDEIPRVGRIIVERPHGGIMPDESAAALFDGTTPKRYSAMEMYAGDSFSTLGTGRTHALAFGFSPDGRRLASRQDPMRFDFSLASFQSGRELMSDLDISLLVKGTSRIHLWSDSGAALGDHYALDFGFIDAGSRATGPRLYSRPSFSGDTRLFTDLLHYAPGMNTSHADIEAVLEAEAAPRLGNAPGHIDPAARRLIDEARRAGWQQLTLARSAEAPQVVFLFNGAGCFAYERVLPLGLHERVVCDGKTLLHLYPELGIGARRVVSRFHRAELRDLVPWFLPPAEDIAHGADIRLIDAQTVAVVPHGAEKVDEDGKPANVVRMHLLFADGRLVERRLVDAAGKALLRELYDAAGGVQWLDGADKELGVHKLALSPATAPSLQPDTSALTILPLPWRSREHVYRMLGMAPSLSLADGPNGCYEYLRGEEALQLLAAEVGMGDGGRAREVIRRCFRAQGQRSLGFYTLLAACGINLADDDDFLADAAERPNDPLARYLALCTSVSYQAAQRRLELGWGGRVGPSDGFFRHLAEFRDLYLVWQHARLGGVGDVGRQVRQAHALDFVRRHRTSPFARALLGVLEDRPGDDPRFQLALAGCWGMLADDAGLAYVARYEQARCLHRGGKHEEARRLFVELYRKSLNEGVLPPLDAAFRSWLQGDGQQPDLWDKLIRETAQKLVADRRRPACVRLAWQCWQLGDQPLAENVLALALNGVSDDNERLATNLSAVAFLQGSDRQAHAQQLLDALLTEQKFADQPGLWRMAGQVAEGRGLTARAIYCLEQALELEFRNLPEVLNLEQVRRDYGTLLGHYDSLARAVVTLRIEPPRDLLERTIRATDRWRTLDRDNGGACEPAARILRTLGAEDLAWDYLTTPIALKPAESDPWVGLAQQLSKLGDLTLADRAYAAAFAAEPTNAQILWDHAQNLKRQGKLTEAHKLLRQIADGQWQPRFEWVRGQARWQLAGSQ